MSAAIRQFLTDAGVTSEPIVGARTAAFAEHKLLGVNTEARTVEAVVSTAALDSYRESVLPSAFTRRLAARWNRNAPLIAGHVYHGADGTPGKIGEWVEMGVRQVPGIGEALVGKCRVFEGTQLADDCWAVMRQSSSVAFSVGFLTHAWEQRQMQVDGSEQSVRTYTDVELIECSYVTVPANPEAVVQATLDGMRQAGDLLSDLATEERTAGSTVADLVAEVAELRELVTQINNAFDFAPGSKAHALILETLRAEGRVAAQEVKSKQGSTLADFLG